MTRSEEEVSIGKKSVRRAERVRLKKVLVEDQVTKTVPVRREEIRLETDPPPEGRIESVEDVDQDSRS
jgi:stress response protein YsnF